jgi:hypothetical protein
MIKYRTAFGQITEIEVEKETEKFVILKQAGMTGKPRREAKRSDWQNYHDSWEDAKTFLINEAKQKVSMAESVLLKAKNHLQNMEAL